MLVTCEFYYIRSIVAENTVLLGYDEASLDIRFPTFRKNIKLSFRNVGSRSSSGAASYTKITGTSC